MEKGKGKVEEKRRLFLSHFESRLQNVECGFPSPPHSSPSFVNVVSWRSILTPGPQSLTPRHYANCQMN